MWSLHVFAMLHRMRLGILHDFAPGCIFHYDKNKPEKVERDPNLVAKEAGKTFSHSSHSSQSPHSWDQLTGMDRSTVIDLPFANYAPSGPRVCTFVKFSQSMSIPRST